MVVGTKKKTHASTQNLSFLGDWSNGNWNIRALFSCASAQHDFGEWKLPWGSQAELPTLWFVLGLMCCSGFLLLFWILQACVSDEHSRQCSLPPCDIVPVPGPREVGAWGGSPGTKEASVLPLCALRAPTLWGTLSWTHLAEVQNLWMVPVTHRSWNTLGNLAKAAQGLWLNGLNWARSACSNWLLNSKPSFLTEIQLQLTLFFFFYWNGSPYHTSHEDFLSG